MAHDFIMSLPDGYHTEVQWPIKKTEWRGLVGGVTVRLNIVVFRFSYPEANWADERNRRRGRG